MKLTGPLHVWELFDRKRTFGEFTLPYAKARELVMAVQFNAITGKGQQRDIVEAHLRKIRSSMEAGEYTPTPAAAGLSKKHRETVRLTGDSFSLDVTGDDPLLLTDAGHRMESVARVVAALEERVAAAQSAEDKERFGRWHKQALACPITFTVHFDGDAQRDFVNLQMGRPVDAAHMLSIKVQQRLIDDPAFKVAFEVAKHLHKQDGSPFKDLIRFDSRGVAPLPISTLCAKNASDLGTSLVGLAKVGMTHADKAAAKDPAWLAGAVSSAMKAIAAYDGEDHDESPILDAGKVLTPISNQGTKGSATMAVGLGVCLAYRLVAANRTTPTADDLARLVTAVRATLDKKVNGNFSGPVKRQLLGAFAREFLADQDSDKHEGVPVGLLTALAACAFGTSPIPAAAKQNGQKRRLR